MIPLPWGHAPVLPTMCFPFSIESGGKTGPCPEWHILKQKVNTKRDECGKSGDWQEFCPPCA